MKTITNILIIFVLLSVINTNSFAQNNNTISKQQAWENVKTQVLKGSFKSKNVYINKNIVNKKQELESIRKINSPSYSSWFFFIDEMPYQSWSHPCKYVFVNSKTGSIEIINSDFPPSLDNMKALLFTEAPKKVKLFDFSKYSPQKDATRDNDYAVIISGGYNKNWNWERYWNHCAAIYSALVNIYGYYDNHIYVLISDGTSSDKDRVINVSVDQWGNWHRK